MSASIWTPAQATTLPRAQVPQANVWLADNRKLELLDRLSLDIGEGTIQLQVRFGGPKGLRVIASLDPTAHGDLLHVSLSYPKHLPSWKDVRLVRNAFFPPTVDVMMVLPREQDYVNVHQFCFHLWQTPIGWGLQ